MYEPGTTMPETPAADVACEMRLLLDALPGGYLSSPGQAGKSSAATGDSGEDYGAPSQRKSCKASGCFDESLREEGRPRKVPENRKGRDIGYALAASFC